MIIAHFSHEDVSYYLPWEMGGDDNSGYALDHARPEEGFLEWCTKDAVRRPEHWLHIEDTVGPIEERMRRARENGTSRLTGPAGKSALFAPEPKPPGDRRPTEREVFEQHVRPWLVKRPGS